ncbi:hypothetical protein [uncultured Akkermansia sp.]|uniref:ADP-ribosyltransferase-containing protein n=1 Tax=uncultured Akkermansia sp. TaxID=512294 RepID=UPI0026137818|nr:hypothetical protein [uncultured Akkermansia sp.]
MNDFSFSENSLAGVPAEGLREEAFSPRLQLEDTGNVTGLEPYGEISHQSFKTMDMVEPPPPVGSGLDFKEALAVYDTLEDGPARVALSNELDKWERRQALENYGSPLGERERREYQQKVERLDALGMDWKAHPEARKKAAEAYGEEWVRAFEAVPDEHKSRVRGEKVLEEFYSRPGDRDGDSMIRYLSSVDAPEGIRGSRDVWDRWNAGRQPFFKAQEKEAEAGRSFAAKAVPVIRAMMNGEGFLEALGKVELTPEEENFAMLHCGYGTPWGQAVQHAADWLRGRGFDLQPEAAVERRAKELADAYVKERERYVSRNDASLSWGGLPNPFSRTMDDFRQEARDEMTGNITDANVFDFARALLDLKTEDPMAAEAVIGLYKADAERLRNDSTLFVSPFNRTMRMMMESSSSLFEQLLLGDVREGDTVEWQPTGESFAPVVRDSEGKQVYRVLTPDQNEMISQIRAMKAEIAESPDGAWWISRQFDGLGRMAAQTSFFLATRGMGTFASVANDRMEELRAQGVSPLESLIRGGIAGGTEVLVERLGGESLFKTLRFLGRKMPFAGKFAGYMGSATDMMKRGLYGNAALRYGVASLAAGGSEWMEEFIQPTLQAPLDAGLARLFGSGNGMTVEDWKELLRGAADPDLGFQMLMFGAVVGGAQIPAFAREARVSRVGAPQIEGLGVGRAEAERIASIVDPVEKSREIFQAALSMSDRAAQLESVRQGFSAMKEDFSWLARQEAYQAEVELLNLPRVEDLGDGSWRFTTTVRDAEGQESYDVLELSEQDATARMQALLHDGIRLRMLEAQQTFAVDRTIDQLSQSGKYVFEDMGRAETVETARKLAEAARLRIAEGADVNAEAQDLGTRMTYGQAAGMDSSFEERVKLGVARGEVSALRRVHSNAYRVAMRNGQTLIRFHKGEVTVPELLEEVLETHLTEDMGNTKHSLDWYANNLRALQDALRKEGYLSKGKDLIRKDGEVSVKDVVEGMSMLAKGDVLARAADMRLPQWMKDFLQMVRQWVSSAKALLDLGTGLHEMERRRLDGESVPIDADFAQMVHALSNSLESYWMQEGARQGEADVQRIVEEVGGSGVSMSLAEDSSPAANFSLVSIPSGDVITTAAEMRARLKPLQGKVFVNKNTGIQAVIEARVSGKTVGKAGASQMSVANLKALGFSAEEARRVHYTAAARIHELFENAEDGFFEEAYKQDASKAGAYHFFNTVDIEGIGAFDVNVTAIKYVKEQEGNVLYTLELTIENPATRGAASREGRLPTPFKDGVSTRNLSSYRSFVEKEKASIRKKAVADGTFMKAPNGKDTNLTEDQWLSVRTEAFKSWFGDWEHDPENASKVVDENGEPKVVYHGTPNEFTVFRHTQQNDAGWLGEGYYFYGVEEESHGYMGKKDGHLMALFLNVRDPYYLSEEEHDELAERDDADFSAEFTERIREDGYDGVYYNGDLRQEWMAVEPTQIKSATDNRGTFDPKNPDITFSIVSAQGQSLFHDGHFETGNAVITEPGVTFSIAALHASPHSFRKFDTAFMGKGEGAQAYGWGLYFAQNPEVNRSYMNQFAKDKTTWKFREVETAAIEEMQRALVGSFLPKDALPEAKEDASDIAWSVLGDLVDAARGSMTVLDIVMELHDEIDTNRKYAETYPQEREKLEQLEGFMLSLLDHLDEIEVRTGMPSNYKVELNVDDSELMGWDYVDETVLALLKDSPVEEVRYALERAERRADYRGENVSGKDVYQELFDAFWDGEDGTKQEAQKAASVSLLSSDIKGIRYADGLSRWKEKEEQTYNYVIFDGNDIKITAFADESTGGAWADYEDPTATFSLSEGFPRRVSRGTQNLEVVHRIAADLRADAATWGRYDGKTDEAAFLVNVGRNVALVKSALMHLPAGYRVAVKPYIDRLQILAELAAKGKIDETRMVNAFARREIKREMAEATREGMEEAEITARVTAAGTAWEKGKKPTQKFAKEVFEDEMEKVRKAWAEKRLHELMAEVMEKAAGKLEALAKDGVSAGMARMLDQVLTIRKKNGKQQKGKVSMEAYAYLTDQVVPLLRMTAMEKEAAMNEAAAELDKLEKENPDQMDGEAVSRMEELREELTRLALYGNLEGMSVDEAQAAAKALEIYINTEKEGWAAVQEAAAERLNAIGRRIVERFNQTGKKADENTLRAANEKFHGKVSFKNFGDFMENMDQLLTRMGTMPALQEFTTDMRSRLTNAFQQMRDARGLRAAAVQDLYEKHLTEKVMKARKVGNMAGWVTWFKTSHDTKVRLNGWITQTARLTLEQAREVREMDARQRKEFIRKRWEEGMEYFSEETLDLLLARLREHEEAAARARAEGRRPVYRKYVTAKASFKGEEGSPLVLSRDNALYLVLQSEQEDYREMMKQQGYTPEVISALREYVGEEGMAIGYGLRELLKAQGDKIGKLYEQVTGVPFPRVENYFPARFWALDAMSDADAADMISGVPSTKGGIQGWQRVRTKHHRRLDTSVGALSVFWEATDMTDHWYYTQDITADFRGLLRRREVAESLVANLGKDDFVRLRRWVDLLERAGVVQGQAVGSLDKLLNAVYSGQAKAILAFRFETLMKQGSAVLNAWIGDPSIGFWDYLGTMAKMRNGTAEMGVIKMMKSAEFQARLNDRVDVETLSRLRDDSSYTLAEAALVWGMNGIEYTDVFFNAVGSAALWNIKYRQAVKAGVEEGRAKDEAWQAVRNALHSAQPQTWIDKSFGGLHRGAWGRAIFYMMSENYNKTAAIYGLARAGFAPGVTPKQRWASLSKAGKVWLAYGAFNAIIGAMLDYMKDDEEEWEKRDWQGYLYAALTGPFAGMPLVSEAVEWMFSELLGAKVYTGSAGRALIDFRSGWNAAWKLGEMMQEGGHEAGDYMKQVIRLGRVFGTAGGIASGMANKTIQTAGQYMTLGAALMNPVKTVADVVD